MNRMSALDELIKLELSVGGHETDATYRLAEKAATELAEKNAWIAELENVIRIIDKTAKNDDDATECLRLIYDAVLKLSNKGLSAALKGQIK
jgi:hypothetical protein